jgi:FkbM family methyltransferase
MHLEERRMPLVLRRLLSDHSCGVDVGSHIGSFLNLLTRCAPKGRHVAFEPSTTKSAWLRRRFPRAEIFPYAVADRPGTALFQEDVGRPGYSRLQGTAIVRATNASCYEVRTCCLDEILLETDRVDLIKLDIEGGELAALRGAARAINKFRPMLIFECGSEYSLAEQKLSRRELYDFIVSDLGYDIFCFTDFLFDKGH